MARNALTILALAAAAVGTSHAAYCHGAPHPGKFPNLNPISLNNGGAVERSVPGGKAFRAGPPDAEFWVVHLWAKKSMYEFGYAYGSMFKPELQLVIDETWKYMEQQVIDAIESFNFPTWLNDAIANFGLEVALGLTYDWTKDYTTPGYYDELHGIADAAGLNYTHLRDIMLIGSLTQGDCSMYGSWGAASADGKTLQLRALDWDTENPAVSYPAVIVYHPLDASLGHTFANVGFLGWTGTLTGQNEHQVAVSEIGVSFPDDTFGNMSRVGVPFTYLLRDILQFDTTLEQARQRITTAHRTCDLILGVGDGKAGMVNAVQYSSSVANFFNDTNLQPLNATWHPRIKSMVYEGMDWDCPGYQKALHDQLQQHWGELTPENTISNVTANVQTGDVHLAVYDLTDQNMYVSFMRPKNSTLGEKYAYQRPFIKLDLTLA